MSNMSYCRFENTSYDLDDCVENLPELMEDFKELSESEQVGLVSLIEYSEKLIEHCKDLGL